MILVDKDIKKLSSEIFQDGSYNEKYVSSVSYDLHIEGIIENEELKSSCTLNTQEIAIVKIQEKISIPDNLMGRIAEKNSRIRQGLSVTGPHYFPGHKTSIFLRVHNVSPKSIRLETGDSIAQIMFEQLTCIPDVTYDKQDNASFNDENDYRGFGRYKDEYSTRMDLIRKEEDKLHNRVDDIYKNLVTIMGIFVSIFSFIIVNFSCLNSANITKDVIIPMNISLGIVITLFMGLIMIFINKAKNKAFMVAYVVLMIVLIMLLLKTL